MCLSKLSSSTTKSYLSYFIGMMPFCLFVCLFVFCLFRAAAAAHGDSQARGQIRAVAAGLRIQLGTMGLWA